MASDSGSGSALPWIALLVGAAALGLALHASKRPAKDREAESEADLRDPKSLEGRITDVEGRLESSQMRIASLEERLEKAERATADAAGLARNAHRTALEAAGTPLTGRDPSPEAPPDGAARKAEADSLLAEIREGRIPDGGTFALFQKARDLGVLDGALAEMEKFVASHQDDADAMVDLGAAYVVKLMTVPDGMERGAWSMKALAQCENALKIQPEHWEAQYMKGMNLSQWPAFLGRQPDAIRTFEKLIEQQERSPSDPRYAQTYYQLGNTYRAGGNPEKARKVFQRGLELFPEDRQLKEQIELLDKK